MAQTGRSARPQSGSKDVFLHTKWTDKTVYLAQNPWGLRVWSQHIPLNWGCTSIGAHSARKYTIYRTNWQEQTSDGKAFVSRRNSSKKLLESIQHYRYSTSRHNDTSSSVFAISVLEDSAFSRLVISRIGIGQCERARMSCCICGNININGATTRVKNMRGCS